MKSKKPEKNTPENTKNSSSKRSINQNQKGKRVERKLVDWFKARSFEARRSEQYAGNSIHGESDVVVDALPSFHIECKGTASPYLFRNTLKSWYQQLMSDVKDDQIPVLFHIANRCPPVIFVPDMGLKRMKITSWCAKLLETDMIRPIEHTGKTQLFLHGYESELVRTVLSSTMYEAVKPGHYFHICDAETFFIMMMTYQEQHGVEKGRKMLQEQYKKEFKTESV